VSLGFAQDPNVVTLWFKQESELANRQESYTTERNGRSKKIISMFSSGYTGKIRSGKGFGRSKNILLEATYA
jgi:hypothetical protein